MNRRPPDLRFTPEVIETRPLPSTTCPNPVVTTWLDTPDDMEDYMCGHRPPCELHTWTERKVAAVRGAVPAFTEDELICIHAVMVTGEHTPDDSPAYFSVVDKLEVWGRGRAK